MTHAFCIESSNLAVEIHQLLQSLDPARWRQELQRATESQLRRTRRELNLILARYSKRSLDGNLVHLYEALAALSRLFEETPAAKKVASPSRLAVEWDQWRRRLQPAYGSLAAVLDRLSKPVPSLRPTNYTRSLFHFGTSLFCVAAIHHLFSPPVLAMVALGWMVFAWTAEILRVRYPSVTRFFMMFMGRIAHPHEHHKVNSSTWYISALAVLATLFSPLAATVAVIVLGVADPAASTVGRRYGRTTLIHGRTLEGSLGFVVAGVLASVVLMRIYFPALSVAATLVVALSASVFGAVAELLSGRRLDDNFSVPVAAAVGTTLAMHLVG